MKKHLKIEIYVDGEYCSKECKYNTLNANCEFFHKRLKENKDLESKDAYKPYRLQECIDRELKPSRPKSVPKPIKVKSNNPHKKTTGAA